jgi:hypothetical protein
MEALGGRVQCLALCRASHLEQLLVDTTKYMADNPRLYVMAVTWLEEHHEIVDVERLARLATKLRGRNSARLGLLLETAQEFIGRKVFRLAIANTGPG